MTKTPDGQVRTHRLKTWPGAFDAAWKRIKTHEVRLPRGARERSAQVARMTWAPRGFRGRNSIRSPDGVLLQAGVHVRVSEHVEGWGAALDRYGVITKIAGDLTRCYVKGAANSGWVPVGDLVVVGAER